MFNLNPDDFTKANGETRPRNSKDYRRTALYMLTHLQEIELYQDLEDEFKCSGMCKTGLFYFGLDLSYGPPK